MLCLYQFVRTELASNRCHRDLLLCSTEAMSVLFVVALQFWVSITWAELCDVTHFLPSQVDYGKYFSVERHNICYVFALEEVRVNKAQDFCRGIGGRLTDVESTTNNSLQNIIAEEMKNFTEINRHYWIGLFWNACLETWYWDADVTRRVNLDSPSTFWLLKWLDDKHCMAMDSNSITRNKCTQAKSFICKLDLGCHCQGVSDNRTCTPRCVDYIRRHQSTPIIATATANPTTSVWNDSTATSDPVINITDTDRCSQVVAECNATQAEDKMVWILLAVLGGITTMLFVINIALCTRNAKYRRMLNDKVIATRISMVDILHADSPSAARRKRPSHNSSSHPGSTSELLYNNPCNTYSSPDSEGAEATETSGFIYNENGYSAPSEKLATENETNTEGRLDRVGNEYSLLNRNGEGLHQEDGQGVYGVESASLPQGDERKISDTTYETYMKQH